MSLYLLLISHTGKNSSEEIQEHGTAEGSDYQPNERK